MKARKEPESAGYPYTFLSKFVHIEPFTFQIFPKIFSETVFEIVRNIFS